MAVFAAKWESNKASIIRQNSHGSSLLPRSFSDGHLQLPLHLDRPKNESAAAATTGNKVFNPALSYLTVAREVNIRRKTGVMKCLVPTLGLLVATKYQDTPNALFLDHIVQLCFLAASLCIYWPTVDYEWEMGFKTSNLIALVCQPVSVISLLTMLLPPHVSLPLFLALTTPLLAWMCYIFRGTIERFFINKIWSKISCEAAVEVSLPV